MFIFTRLGVPEQFEVSSAVDKPMIIIIIIMDHFYIALFQARMLAQSPTSLLSPGYRPVLFKISLKVLQPSCNLGASDLS